MRSQLLRAGDAQDARAYGRRLEGPWLGFSEEEVIAENDVQGTTISPNGGIFAGSIEVDPLHTASDRNSIEPGDQCLDRA